MKQKSLDTSVVLRWLLDDIHDAYLAAQKIIESDQKLHIADVAINELVLVLERVVKLDRETIGQLLQAITERRNIICNRGLIAMVMPSYLHDPKLSFTDCCLAVYAELNNASPLLTFDRKLAGQLETAELLL